MKLRKKVFFANLFIIALCIVSILAYFFMPFWTVNVKYTLTAESMHTLLPSSGEGSGENDSGEPIDALDVYSNLDFTEIVGDGITLQVGISLETEDILNSLSAEPTELVESILDANVANLVGQLDETLNVVVKKVVTSVVKVALTEGIKDEIKKKLGEGTTDETAKEKLNEIGLDDAYIDEKTNQLVDSIYKDGATPESAAEETLDIVEEAVQKMKDSGNPDYEDIEFTDETREELKADLMEQFKNFENEDGSIDPEAFTSEFLLNMLKGENSSEGETSARLATPLSVKATEATTEQDAKEELRTALTEKLMEALDGAEKYVATAIQILAYVILATFVIWAFPILKILLKLTRKNNAIKVGGPIWFGSIPYVVLCLLPTIALSFAGNVPELSALSGLSITFSSCGIVSFVAGIVLAVFCLFFYRRMRKELRYAKRYAYEREYEREEQSPNKEKEGKKSKKSKE